MSFFAAASLAKSEARNMASQFREPRPKGQVRLGGGMAVEVGFVLWMRGYVGGEDWPLTSTLPGSTGIISTRFRHKELNASHGVPV